MYLVVIFPESNGDIAVIPENWLVDDCYALWPPFVNDSTRKKAVERCTEPETNWVKFKVEQIGRRYGMVEFSNF
jgi:hypothetical protein